MVGLAVARQLAAREGTSTILLERHDAPGTETSSRNSEVCISAFQKEKNKDWGSMSMLIVSRSSTPAYITDATR